MIFSLIVYDKKQPPRRLLFVIILGRLFLPAQQDAVIIQPAAHIFGELIQQAVHRGVGAFFPADIQHNVAGIHHQRAVAQFQGGVHVVGNHQAGDVVFGHSFLGQLQHLICGGGVQGRSVLVQQQQFGGNQGGHQ